jgi:hypothetical protein
MTNKHKCMISGCENSVSAKELIKHWRERAENLHRISPRPNWGIEELNRCADELEAALAPTTGEDDGRMALNRHST